MTARRKSESMTLAGKLAVICRDEAIDDPPEGQHGHAAAGHHRVVELAEVEAGSKAFCALTRNLSISLWPTL